jgi:Zn-dependent metalloprotease
VHEAQNTQRLPGVLVRSEGQDPTGDIAVNEAYDGLGHTYQLYADEYERDSIDDQGMRLIATVHYDENYDNAFWDGTQMVFGDGDGELFNRFTIALDIIGHELSHGVVEDEAGLIYWRQSGALNESIADVFGSLVKQYAAQETAEAADWLIGEGLFTDNVNGVALRSMKAPGTAYDDPVLGKDPQPATMDGYVITSADNGGVHINSGIPNHAFYLAAVELGGYAWEKAGRIWYEALLSPRMFPRMGFRGFSLLTSLTAAQLYGPGSPEARAVGSAWSAVSGRPSVAAALGDRELPWRHRWVSVSSPPRPAHGCPGAAIRKALPAQSRPQVAVGRPRRQPRRARRSAAS